MSRPPDDAWCCGPRKTMIVAWVGAVVVFALFVVVAVLLRTAETGVFFRLADQIAMVADRGC